MPTLSQHNIVSRIEGSPRWFIVNPLSGQADVLEPEEAARLATPEALTDPELQARGYVVDPDQERAQFQAAYLDFLEARDKDEIQLFFVPSYACNFTCAYCYQKPYENPERADTRAVLGAFFDYTERAFAGRRKYVTLFGGEPLLPDTRSAEVVELLAEGARARDLELAVVTNGYHLERYLDTLMRARIREIQITLDGPAIVHDGRRHLASGGPTFDVIARGVDAALARDIPVNLRTVVDRENLPAYVELAHFAAQRGWTSHPRFKTQIGRSYELHECQSDPGRLYSRVELYREFYALARDNPELLAFHRSAFAVARHLFDQGRLPAPLYDACPATKTEWAFDYTGRIYPCTAMVGKADEALGTFYPEVTLDEERVEAWEQRDVLSIERCGSCNLRLACGGGCGAVAKNRAGTVAEPDCRPVKELLELGMALYGAQEEGHSR